MPSLAGSTPSNGASCEKKKADEDSLLTPKDAINLGLIKFSLPEGEYPVLARRYVDADMSLSSQRPHIYLLVVTNLGRSATLTVRWSSQSHDSLVFDDEQEGFCGGVCEHSDGKIPRYTLEGFTALESFALSKKCLESLRWVLGVWRDVPWVDRMNDTKYFLAGYLAASRDLASGVGKVNPPLN